VSFCPARRIATLTVTNVQFVQAGRYAVIVSNAAGAVTSTVATLAVLPALPPQFCTGDPDASFQPALNFWNRVAALAVQPDGRILASPHDTSALGCFYADVTSDVSFASELSGWAGNIVVQPDAKVLVSGELAAGGRNLGVARINPNGTLDPSFNVSIGTNGYGSVGALVLQPAGKVLIGGSFTNINGQARYGVARLHPDGSLDASFVPDRTTPLAVWAMMLQADGRVVLACAPVLIQGRTQPTLLRLNADGSLDPAFQVPVEGSVYRLAPLPSGQFYIAGDFFAVHGVPRHTLARLNADGSLDLSFNPSPSPAGLWIDWADTMLPLSNGQTLVAGEFPQTGVGVLRYNVDGSVDPGFQVVLADTTDEDDPVVSSFAGQPDGNVLIGGYFNRVNGLVHWHLARLFLESRNCPATVPVVTVLPGSLTNFAGVTVEFVASVTGAQPLACQWLCNGTLIAGETNASLRLNNVQTSHTGDYSVIVAAATGSVASSAVHLSVLPFPAVQPVSLTRFAGQSAQFSVSITGIEVLRYRWSLNSVTIPGATNATLALSNVQSANAGSYGVMITIPQGDVGSSVGHLTVLPVPAGPGSLDITFDPTVEGEQVGLSSVDGAAVYALAVQLDGKTVVGGRFSSINGVPRNNIARLHPDGSVDVSFDPGWGTDGDARCVALQADGKVVIGGDFTTVNGERRNGVAQLLADGALDIDFEPILELDGYVRTVAVQPSGEVLLGGHLKHVNGLACTNIARLNRDGSVDTSFGPRVAWDDEAASVYALLVRHDGKILVAGYFGRPLTSVFRLNADGTLDPSFVGAQIL
jgi:uncharacterized delta-60 repeat protein